MSNQASKSSRLEKSNNASPRASGWELDYENLQNFGEIQLTDETTINASGKGGGSIQVYGSQVSLFDGSRIFSFTFGSQVQKEKTPSAAMVRIMVRRLA